MAIHPFPNSPYACVSSLWGLDFFFQAIGWNTEFHFTKLNLQPILSRELITPEPSIMLRRAQLIKLCKFGRRELEFYGSKIVTEALLFGTRRDRYNVLIDAPAETNLSLTHSVLLRESGQELIHWAGFRLGCS